MSSSASKKEDQMWDWALKSRFEGPPVTPTQEDLFVVNRRLVSKNDDLYKEILKTQSESQYDKTAQIEIWDELPSVVQNVEIPRRPNPFSLTSLEPAYDVVRNYATGRKKRSVEILHELPLKRSKSEPIGELDFDKPVRSRERKSDGLSRIQLENIEADRVVDEFYNLMTQFNEKSNVWSMFRKKFDNDVFLEQQLKVWLRPKNPSSAIKHLCILRRLMNDLKLLGESSLDWSPGVILNLFIYRAGENNASASTFTSILSTLAYVKNLLDLTEDVTDPKNVVLRKYASTFHENNLKLVSRAEPIQPECLAKLEKMVVSGHEFSRPEKKLNFVTRIWAWNIRLLAGAGIRWSDAQYTHPKTSKLFAEGLFARGEKTKTKSKREGNPWSCASLGLSSPGWLEIGYDLFRTLPGHDTRDFWMCLDKDDGDAFSLSFCDFKRATFHIRRLLLLVGVPLEKIADFRPHSLKPTLLSLAIHQSFEKTSPVSTTEIALLGNWTAETCQNMTLTYLRDKQIARHLSGRKIWDGVMSEDIKIVNLNHFKQNEQAGLPSFFKDKAIEGEKVDCVSSQEEVNDRSSDFSLDNSPASVKSPRFSQENKMVIEDKPGFFDISTFVNELDDDTPLDFSAVLAVREMNSKRKKHGVLSSRDENLVKKPRESQGGDDEVHISLKSEVDFFITKTRHTRVVHVAPRNGINVCKKGERLSKSTLPTNYHYVCHKCYDGLSQNLKKTLSQASSGSRCYKVSDSKKPKQGPVEKIRYFS